MKKKKHTKSSHISSVSRPLHHRGRIHQQVPFIAVIATIVLVVLGLGVWLQSAVAGLAQ